MEGSDDTSAAVGRIPDVGEVVEGRYRLEEVIATGGMGVIMRAHQLAMERDVAVKLLHPHMISDPETVARFEREVHLAKRLTHPNTIQLFDFGRTDGGSMYIVMEYLRGEDLRHLVGEEGPLPAGRAVEIGLQALEGLAAAHDQNVIHRDIKPSNIFVSRRRRGGDLVKLLDFGVAKSLEAGQQDLTATGKICGTPKYMPPEAVLQDESGKAGDVYAIGLILLEMMIGRQVFDGNGMAQIILMQLQKPAPIPERIADTELAEVIRRSCAKHPGERFQDADAMLDALEAAAETVPGRLQLTPGEVPELPTPDGGNLLAQLGGSTPPGLQVLEDNADLQSHEVVPDHREDGSSAGAAPSEETSQMAQPTFPPGEEPTTPRGHDRSQLHQTPGRADVDAPTDAAPHHKPTEENDPVHVHEDRHGGRPEYKPTEQTASPFADANSPHDRESPPASHRGPEPTGAPPRDEETTAERPRDLDDLGSDPPPDTESDLHWGWVAGIGGVVAVVAGAGLLWTVPGDEPIEINPASSDENTGNESGATNSGPAIELSASIVQKSVEEADRTASRRAESTRSTVKVTVESSPEGAELIRDGQPSATTPATLRIPTDRSIEVRVRKSGYRSHTLELDGSERQTYSVELDRESPRIRTGGARPTVGGDDTAREAAGTSAERASGRGRDDDSSGRPGGTDTSDAPERGAGETEPEPPDAPTGNSGPPGNEGTDDETDDGGRDGEAPDDGAAPDGKALDDDSDGKAPDKKSGSDDSIDKIMEETTLSD